MLKNKNAIITGARRGIGRTTVEVFASHGANIWACARAQNNDFEADMQSIAKKYGVNIWPVYFDVTDDDRKEYSFLGEEYAFSVCRIEKENNVHLTLEAFSKLPPKKLVIVGNWNKSDFSKKLRCDYSHYDNIVLLDPIFDKRRINLLRSNCSIYIHGHQCGGTNPSLVEAMYLGCAILAYDVSYNRETTENKAVYFQTADDIQSLVSRITSEQISALKKEMKEIACRRYTWDRIASLYSRLF